jgi:hypothetical protein
VGEGDVSEERVSVLAHRLMNSVATVSGRINIARRLVSEGVADPARVEHLLGLAEQQANEISEALRDLVLGRPHQ